MYLAQQRPKGIFIFLTKTFNITNRETLDIIKYFCSPKSITMTRLLYDDWPGFSSDVLSEAFCITNALIFKLVNRTESITEK